MTPAQLQAIAPLCPKALLELYANRLTAAMMEHDINTVTRAAYLLGNLCVESGDFRFMQEMESQASGLHFANYEPGTLRAARLGNTSPGDGARFPGRGPIQLSGRKNYTLAGNELGLDLVGRPELAAHPDHMFRIACRFWVSLAAKNLSPVALTRLGANVNLNDVADRLDFEGTVIAINGGFTNLEERRTAKDRALGVLFNAHVLERIGATARLT